MSTSRARMRPSSSTSDSPAGIAAGCNPGRFDAADLGRRAVASGNPVIPLVRDLAAGLPADAARWVHLGATSQDVLDTAAALVAREALAPILADLDAAAERCASLAEQHRDTILAGRT